MLSSSSILPPSSLMQELRWGRGWVGGGGAPCSLSQIIGFVQKHQDGKYTLAAHLVLMNIIILCSLTIRILNCGLIQ